MERKLGVMLVGNEPRQLPMVEQALRADGHSVVAQCNADCDLQRELRVSQPDIVVMLVDTPSRQMLDALSRATQECPRPVLLFATRGDPATIRRAIQAGASVYVIDGMQPHRLGAVIEVGLARFQMQGALQKNLRDMREQLADERDIERAKGILMKHRKLDESEALTALQRMATDRLQSLGEFARSVLSVAAAI